MESTVGVRRAIVEEEGLRVRSVDKLPFVELGGAALQIMVAELRCWSWSSEPGLASDARWVNSGITGGAHGKEALGSLMVDCHDFDMIPYIPYPRGVAEVGSSVG